MQRENDSGIVKDSIVDDFEAMLRSIVDFSGTTSFLKEVPILKNLLAISQGIRDVRNMMFCNRIKKLLDGMSSVTQEDIKKFEKKFENQSEKEYLCTHVLLVLESIAEDEKTDLIVSLFLSFLKSKISKVNLRRFLHVVDKCLFADIVWLNQFQGKELLSKNINLQGLVGTGLVENVDGQFSSDDGKSWDYKYQKSNLGSSFCSAAFNDTYDV